MRQAHHYNPIQCILSMFFDHFKTVIIYSLVIRNIIVHQCISVNIPFVHVLQTLAPSDEYFLHMY